MVKWDYHDSFTNIFMVEEFRFMYNYNITNDFLVFEYILHETKIKHDNYQYQLSLFEYNNIFLLLLHDFSIYICCGCFH